jgi:phage/conjugal plasmid C-4 type zinc finger TraR family protein
MPDDADIASRFEQAERNALIAAARKKAQPGLSAATHCEECGDPIPEGRRRAMPGCTLCVPCQVEFDGGS